MTYDKSRFDAAVSLWREWNERINVISRKDIDNLYDHHILHSLCIQEYLERFHPELPDGQSFLDVGCGGGFPGIPMAVSRPKDSFTLCDSIGKKVKVAAAVAEGLGLSNVSCINARAETVPGQFDWVISRAVTSLDKFYPWVKGKYRRGILYLKGGDVNAEISELARRCKVNPGNVRVWPVSEWLDDDYFVEKFVIEIGKQ